MKQENIQHLRQEILLALQTALLGMIDSDLRAVAVDWSKESIAVVLYFNRDITGIDEEAAFDIEAELVAVFPDFTVSVLSTKCVVALLAKEENHMAWAYFRKE